MRKDKLDVLATWAAEERGCGAQTLADGLRRVSGGEADVLEQAVRWRAEGRGTMLATVVEAGEERFGPGVRIAVSDDGRVSGVFGDGALEEAVASVALEVLRGEAPAVRGWERVSEWEWRPGESGTVRILLEPLLPAWELAIFGSGRVPRALAAVCSAIGIPFRVYHADPEAEGFPGAREVVCGPWEEIGSRFSLGVRSHCVVATPHHEGDPATLRQLLRMAHLPYVGLLQNRARAIALVRALREEQVPIHGRFHCPIGLSVATKDQGQIAVAILAEVLAEVNGAEVRRMGLDWASGEGESEA